MIRVLLMLVVTALLGQSGAWAQVVLDPPTPKAFFEVRVKVSGTAFVDMDGFGDHFDPFQTTVSMVGNKITVSPLMTGKPDFSAGLPPENLDQTIGALPPGTYQVEVVRRASGRGTPGPLGNPVTFTVAPRNSSIDPLANFTDIWWTPSEPGWGLGLFQHPSNQLFGVLFVYGSDGKPNWYAISGGAFTNPYNYQGTIYRTTGPYFGGDFNSSAVGVQPVGAATIEFNLQNLSHGIIIYTIDGVRVVKLIERQPY